MTFAAILKDLQKGKFAPLYFLHGEESYYIDYIADYIKENALTEAQRDFNQHIFYAKETDPQDVLNTARRYPVFAERQVLLVREAQDFRNMDLFVDYVKKPVPSTILVFSHKHKTADKRKAFYKAIKDKAVVLESSKLKEYKVPEWIGQHLSTSNYKIKPKANQLLADHIGNDLSRLVNELDKLMLNLGDRKEITSTDIEKYIGISKDYNSFEFKDAVSSRNFGKAFGILNYFKHNPKAGPYPFLMALLYGYFSVLFALQRVRNLGTREMAQAVGMPEFIVKNYASGLKHYDLNKSKSIIGLLAETDMKTKGVDSGSMDNYDIIIDMVYKIMH